MIFLDTNVLSELVRECPDTNVLGWFQSSRRTELATTSVSKAEVLFGLESMADGRKRRDLSAKIHRLFVGHFDGRVVPFDEVASEWYGRVRAKCKRKGKFPGDMDTMIAAIALSHDASLATRNTKDFEAFAIDLINPWNFEAGCLTHARLVDSSATAREGLPATYQCRTN
ncbi:type II toxin-antitoxin system VapC family toxin [Luteibacter pinisoli]|uniref:Ribonuclease VapC n=1 Tax=Luteibacter pinisoli TaxID=2589080 RepID=A0A4Y5Z890_9GAMM|nr:type II toxin-antitoxin system VapC family toxin [Luteibacter pinisoli]QDE41474.1 type II toxin-antitoxin system VapC family toxin [Luteibacter pinisoli]